MSRKSQALLRVLVASAGVLAITSQASFGQTVDGSITQAEYGTPTATQDTKTHFGNNISELDALFTKAQPNGNLSVGLTGNIESNGNAMVLLIDSHTGGGVASVDANGFGTLGSIPGQYTDDLGTDTDGSSGVNPTPGGGSVMPKGFNPDFAIEVNNNDGFGGLNYFVNVIDLSLVNDPPASGPDNRDFPLGSNATNGPAVTQAYISGTITHAFNNTNTQGVNDWNDADLGDPLSATTGLELELSSDFLQTNLASIGVMAFITNASGDFLSNQFLPGIGGFDNLGGPGAPGFPMLNAETLTTLSVAQVPVPEPASIAGVIAIAIFIRRARR